MASEWRNTAYGEFSKQFTEARLSDLCAKEIGIQTGPFGSQLHQKDYVTHGTPIITVEHLGENRIIHEDLPYVSDADRERLSRYALRKGDIVFSRVGSVDRRALVGTAEDSWLFSGRCLRVRPDAAKLDPAYLSYFFGLPAFRDYISSIAVGATMPSLNTQILSDVPVIYPPLPEQRAIAHILGTLDDKIELNRRRNETLEEMARALFKSWFMDFDPVRAKMEGRWRPGESLPGLPAECYDLFPDRLVPSELGDIPEGWEVKTLGDVVQVNPTRTLRKGQSAPYLEMANMPTKGHTPKAMVDRPFGSGMRFINGDTLLARITPCLENGKTAFVDFLKGDEVGWGSTEYIVMRPWSPFPNEFAYCLARSHDLREFAIQGMSGTSGRQRVSAEALSQYLMPVASNRVAEAFGRLVQPLVAKAADAMRESRTLAAERDALLPKLVSGEVRVGSTVHLETC